MALADTSPLVVVGIVLGVVILIALAVSLFTMRVLLTRLSAARGAAVEGHGEETDAAVRATLAAITSSLSDVAKGLAAIDAELKGTREGLERRQDAAPTDDAER